MNLWNKIWCVHRWLNKGDPERERVMTEHGIKAVYYQKQRCPKCKRQRKVKELFNEIVYLK